MFWKKIAFCLLSTVILVAPVWLLLSNFLDVSGPQGMPNPHPISPVTNNYPQYHPTLVYSPEKANGDPSDLCVIFQYLSVDPATDYVEFNILIEVTKQGRLKLDGLAQAPKNVQLQMISNSGLSTFYDNIPFSALKNSPQASCSSSNSTASEVAQPASELIHNIGFAFLQNIFVLNQTRAFPQDWYELNDSVTVYAGRTKLIPSIIMMTRNYDLPMSVNLDSSSSDGRLEFVIDRPSWVIAYTYIVSLMPIFLLVVLIGIQRARRQDPPKPHEIAFGVAATIVAILPLHAVLIPSAFSDHLTRLDIIFGTEVILLVVLSVIGVGLWKFPSRADRQVRPPRPPCSP